MTPEHIEIVYLITEYLEKHPDIRFGQALANLNITLYNYNNPTKTAVDMYYDSDKEILKRMKL